MPISAQTVLATPEPIAALERLGDEIAELSAHLDAATARLLALWEQIARHYQKYPDTLVFEVLNEPHEEFDGEAWNAFCPLALATIRQSNPHRAVMLGPGAWNGIGGLENFDPPQNTVRVLIGRDVSHKAGVGGEKRRRRYLLGQCENNV